MRYGVWRINGLDHRENGIHLPLKQKIESDGGKMFFYENRSSSGDLATFVSSVSYKPPICTVAELSSCDVIDTADSEILVKAYYPDEKIYFRLIDPIPPRVKIVITVWAPLTTLKQFSKEDIDRVSAFMLKWDAPLPPNFPKEKICVIKHSINTDFFSKGPNFKRDPTTSGFRIAYAATLNFRKGLGELLSAFKTVNEVNSDTKLVLMGADPAYIGEYFSGTGEILYEGLILDGDKFKDKLLNCDVFCQPRLTDQPPCSMYEAMSCGLPLLTLDNGLMEDELIEHGVNGYVCKNIDELSKHLVELASDPALVKRLGEQSRRKALNDFKGEKAADQILDLMTKIGVK